MKIKELSKYQRPMEKLSFYGKDKLEHVELLAIIIKTGTKDKSALKLSYDILSNLKYGICELADISLEELMMIEGIGMSKASSILAALELGKRVHADKRFPKAAIEGVDDVVNMYISKFQNSQKEHFEIIMINSKGAVLGINHISKGDLTSSVVHPRETFKEAIRRSAAGIICVHNHPSGDARPSADDIKTTKKLAECGKILGIDLVDHIIIGKDAYFSMRKENII